MKPLSSLPRFTALALASAALLYAGPAVLAAPDAATVLSELPARVQAPTDSAQFRRFVLSNGMRVLLVSDPKFNKSAASLVVNVGQIDDPGSSEGLAHFLEHMLFLGTEKYPDVSDYGNFIRANGGYNNAYTSTDHTNYQFEVRHEAFAGALDRFAQFFIAPKFNPEFVGREVNAVNNEAMRHVQNDERRRIGVSRELYNPQSVEVKFSTGTKETLANATPAVVRAFYEAHYTANHMALSLTGKASLDELEKLARDNFSAVPKRNVPPVVREAKFLPKKQVVRMAYIEPIKELRRLNLEFMIPGTRPDFASRSDQLLLQLLTYAGPGGLVELLKREGLANAVGADTWERTGEYGSLLLSAELTPAGQKDYKRVMQLIFGYLEHLRTAPFPAAFYQERARIAQLNETYRDRGEGAALATKLSNQALFYPLEVAERASDVWGKPDEAAYRKLLASLTPDTMLASLMAKGQPVDKHERIYKTGYSYAELTGADYDALAKPAKLASFALPGGNRFMPGATALLAERPLPLISEPGVQLFYAEDTEFQRPQTTLVFRFVPVRDLASADSLALLKLFDTCLKDALEPALDDAQNAGLEFSSDASLEGYKFTVTGYGDSPVRFANYLAGQLRSFKVTPQRFEALREVSLRGLQSYAQTEAYALARDRRDALSREFHYLPDELVARTGSADWAQVQAFGQRFFAQGKLEAVVHGHLAPEQAVAVTRSVAASLGAKPAPAGALLQRRHLVIKAGENVLDSGDIAGVNSAVVTDFMLPDDSATTRAAAVVLANFFGEPFYTELRTKQQLGYIVGSSAAASLRQRYFTFVVQSSEYGPAELRKRAEAFLATVPAQFNALTDAQWATLVAGARSRLEEKPKNMAEKAEQFFAAAYTYDGDWSRRQAALDALATLTRAQAAALLAKTLDPSDAQRRTVLLRSPKQAGEAQVAGMVAERSGWKATRQFN